MNLLTSSISIFHSTSMLLLLSRPCQYICKEEFIEHWDTILEHMPHLGQDNFSERLNKLFHRMGPLEAPLYAKGGVSTFFHKPLYPSAMEERPPADCVFFGCPFDAGSTYRSGLRFGPKKIREVSQMLLTDCSNKYMKTEVKLEFATLKVP